MARSDRIAKKTGLSLRPILIYVAAVLVVSGGLFSWDLVWRRREEVSRRPPPPEVLAKNLVENIIGRDTVHDIKIDQAAGTVDISWESATYPPAARATVTGTVLARNLDQLLPGLRVEKSDPLVYVRTSDGKTELAAAAEFAGRVIKLLVKPGDKVEEGRAMVLIEPFNKSDARKNLETEGLLGSQVIMAQFATIRTVTAQITYQTITLAVVAGKRGEKGAEVTASYHESLQ